jgi:hypothetical protein
MQTTRKTTRQNLVAMFTTMTPKNYEYINYITASAQS